METLKSYSTADGVTIAYRHNDPSAATDRPPLVLIHGAASNMNRWSEFAEETALAARHPILRLDLRGHAAFLHRGRLNLGMWCDDIVALLRHEHYQGSILVGHCLGANIAALFAARYPQYCAGLVLVEPMLREAFRVKLGRVLPYTSLLRGLIAVIRLGNRLGLYRRHLQGLDLRALDAELRSHLGTSGGAEFLASRYGSPWRDLKIMPSANLFQDLLEVLRPLPLDKVHVPFLALLSTGQGFVDSAKTEALLARLAHGEVHILQAEHWIPAEQPQAMRQEIECWVDARDWSGN